MNVLALLVQPLRKAKPSKPRASNQEALDEGSNSAEDTPLAEDAEPAMSESSGTNQHFKEIFKKL